MLNFAMFKKNNIGSKDCFNGVIFTVQLFLGSQYFTMKSHNFENIL